MNDRQDATRLSICTDCLVILANGDWSGIPERDLAEFEAAYKRGTEGTEITLGMLASEHSCRTHVTLDEFGEPDGDCLTGECDCPTAGDDGGECFCEDLGFSWSPCEICKRDLGGDRHAATMWTDSEAFTEYLAKFINGYCEAMLWSNTTEHCEACTESGPCEDHTYGYKEIDPAWWQSPSATWQLDAFSAASQASITSDCADFARFNWDDLQSADYGSRGREYGPAECAGHDFALSRNGHGAGFFDRGFGDLGNRLQEAARVYGSSEAWFTDGQPVRLEDES